MRAFLPMKGVAAALTPPHPRENSNMHTPKPAAAVPSRCMAAGKAVKKRINAPTKTILENRVNIQPTALSNTAIHDLRGREKGRSEAPKPCICNDSTEQRSEVREGHEGSHDQSRRGLFQTRGTRDLYYADRVGGNFLSHLSMPKSDSKS